MEQIRLAKIQIMMVLTDNNEINIYNTDPVDEDTDDDELLDGDEIDLGLDPLNPDS